MISEFPLFIFTMFSGASAGLYGASVVFRDNDRLKKRPWLLQLVCLILLGIGLLGSLVHLGQPTRFLNALAHASAPIALEAYCSMAFGVLVLVDMLMVQIKKKQVIVLQAIAAIAGLALTVITGYAYFECFGIPAWASFATLPFFLLGDIALGLSLLSSLSNTLIEKKQFTYSTIIANVLYLVDLIGMGVHFAACGENLAWICVSALAGPILCSILALIGQRKKMKNGTCALAIAILMVISVAIVRYSFYSIPSI